MAVAMMSAQKMTLQPKRGGVICQRTEIAATGNRYDAKRLSRCSN